MIFGYPRAFFEIPIFDQVISSPKVAQIGSIGSYRWRDYLFSIVNHHSHHPPNPPETLTEEAMGEPIYLSLCENSVVGGVARKCSTEWGSRPRCDGRVPIWSDILPPIVASLIDSLTNTTLSLYSIQSIIQSIRTIHRTKNI